MPCACCIGFSPRNLNYDMFLVCHVCVIERDKHNSELAMAAITEDTEDTTEAMEALLGAELAAGVVVAAASEGALTVVAAPHLEPGLLLDSAAQGEDEEERQQSPRKFSLFVSIMCVQCSFA